MDSQLSVFKFDRNENGEIMIFEQTRVTAKGIDYVRKLVDKHYDAWRKATTKGMN